jgi:hypothetical protein
MFETSISHNVSQNHITLKHQQWKKCPWLWIYQASQASTSSHAVEKCNKVIFWEGTSLWALEEFRLSANAEASLCMCVCACAHSQCMCDSQFSSGFSDPSCSTQRTACYPGVSSFLMWYRSNSIHQGTSPSQGFRITETPSWKDSKHNTSGPSKVCSAWIRVWGFSVQSDELCYDLGEGGWSVKGVYW